jgi:predicted transposase/invertase (TIGR01784 family)
VITDPVFYRLFESSPETFFLLLGMSADAAKDMAARYQYEAIEVKETSHRLDGVFRPTEPDLPLYFVEVQFYNLPSVFAGLLAKAYTYLKQHDPAQRFQGVVLFATRALEPVEVAPYQPLLDAGQVRRFYLDEIPELADAPLGLAILYLIRKTEGEAAAAARELVSRAKKEIEDEALRDSLIELIETVIIYKLSRLSREEVQAMLQVYDIRETRVYQEAKEEGVQEERQRNLEEKLGSVGKWATFNIPAERIAEILGLDEETVRKHMAKNSS